MTAPGHPNAPQNKTDTEEPRIACGDLGVSPWLRAAGIWIVCIAEENTSGLETAIIRTQREIDLIREYRTRLVADVVTGKLDVRGVELAAYDEDLAELDEALVDENEAGEEELELADEAEGSAD